MAQHVQDSTVIERRLRPIYDSLEVGNNKKALQDVDKLLKKHPSLTCARALKALALLRLGREEESNNLLAAVNSEKPTDDPTLQVLTFCYKEMEQLEKICDLYSYAAKQSPGNEETLAHLFISYVRLDDYKSQQSVALQLYKTKPKNPYYFWAVMSVVLQGIRGPESEKPDKRKLYLALADRMVDKLISDGKLETEQEIQLYLSILEEQNKYKQALDFLTGPVCEQLYPGAPVYIKINLLKKLDMWKEMNELLCTLLKEDRDRWDYYQDYLTSTFKLHEMNPKNDDGISIMDACHDFLCQLIENGKKVRGPYLARLELHKRLRENQINANEILGEFSNLLIEYFRLFGNKSCCTHDITLFLSSMELEDRLLLASELLKKTNINSTLPQSKDQLQKHICCLQIARICGSHINVEPDHLLAFYTSLKLHYEHGLSVFGKDLLPTDIGPSDAYALLAANVMFDISVKKNTSKYLLEALCLLLYVLKNSPSNFHVKLLCLRIYHIFGCLLEAYQMYDSLDIKHIQLDSMGYLHCNLLPLSGGLNGVTKQIYDSTLKFFTTSYKERLEYIAMSYKFGSFSKLLEFMDFRDRLSNSIHYAVISAEEIILELVNLNGTFQQNLNYYKSMNIRPQEERIRWNELSDNRDLSVMVRWDPLHLVDTQGEKIDSFNQEIESLQIRSILLRLVSSIVELLHCPSTKTILKEDINSGEAKDTEVVELLRDKWIGLFERLRQMNYKKPEKRFLVDLLPSRLHILLELPYEKFFSDLLNFIIDFYTGSLELNHIDILNNNVTGIATIIQSQIDKHNASDDELWIRSDVQCQIYCAIEILSLYAFVLSCCHEKYTQVSQNAQSKKTKRKETKTGNTDENSITDKERLQIINDLMRFLKTTLNNCGNAISSWKAPQFNFNLSECMSGMSLDPKIEMELSNEVKNNLNENHDLIVFALKNLIKDKSRMVNK